MGAESGLDSQSAGGEANGSKLSAVAEITRRSRASSSEPSTLESLDYEVIENSVYREDQARKGKVDQIRVLGPEVGVCAAPRDCHGARGIRDQRGC